MDRAISLEAGTVNLAIEPSFCLGPARIDPPAHTISWGGESRRLQPQPLKVLVALHDRLGQVVTRDELIDRCWSGRFVGDDVINRCISLLRRVAAESGGIEIETVPKGGYRLTEAQPPFSGEEIRPDIESPEPTRRRMRIAATVAALGILVVGGAGVVTYQRFSTSNANAVMLEPFSVAGNAPAARTLAGGVSADVAGALSAASVDVVDPGSKGQSGNAAFVLGGSSELVGPNLHLNAELRDAGDHTVLWSTSFTRPSSDIQAMQEQIAANLAGVLHCALDTAGRPNVETDRPATELYLKACALEQSVDPPSFLILDLLRQVTTREPGFAAAWARLALWAADSAFSAGPREADALRREARFAAQKAIRLDPKSGIAYEALTNLELGHVPFAQLHAEFQKILSFDPDNANVLDDDGELLLRMGRVDDGVRAFRRAFELNPLSAQYASDLIDGLIDDGSHNEANALLQRAIRLWPDDNMLKIIHCNYEVRFDDPGAALKTLGDPDARPQKIRDVTLETYRRLAETRRSGKPAAAQAFDEWLNAQIATGKLGVDDAVPYMVEFGDVNDAFRDAFATTSQVPIIDPEFLWKPESLALRRDPRFIALAAKFRVADFWRTTQTWPDYCSSPGLRYNCRARTSALGQSSKTS